MKECEIKPYIKKLTDNTEAQEILNNHHNQIFQELVDSKTFNKWNRMLFESKQISKINAGRNLVKAINKRFNNIVTKITTSQQGKNYVFVNVKNLLPETLEQLQEQKEIGTDFYMGDETLKEQEELNLEDLYDKFLSISEEQIEQRIKECA